MCRNQSWHALNLSVWMALLAPAKTPRPIIDQPNKAVIAALDAETKAKLAESGIEVATSSPEEVRQLNARNLYYKFYNL